MVTAKEHEKIWQEGYKVGFMLFAGAIKDALNMEEKDTYDWNKVDENMRDIQYDNRRKTSAKT